MTNPYQGLNFFAFFVMLGKRCFRCMTGQLSLESWAADEVQLATLVLIACSAAILGVFLVLRRMTMLANSLSHTTLLGVALLFLWSATSYHLGQMPFYALLLAALFVGMLTSWLTEWFHNSMKIQADASIAFAFTLLFSLGIVVVTLFMKNVHIGNDAIMGNADALQVVDIQHAAYLLGTNMLLLFLFFRRLVVSTFDPLFAQLSGLLTRWISHLILFQTAAIAISAFRAVGVLLFLAFLVAPVVIGGWFARSLQGLIFGSCCVGTVVAMIGVALSRSVVSWGWMPLSTGGMIVSLFAGIIVVGISCGARSKGGSLSS
ncbi:MAG: metal ABC transporter permease [Chlamydiota bacterium]|nr:metal ABC transporter permease [Chlamydiota bacterium]